MATARFIGGAVAALACTLGPAAAHAEWSKTFVTEWMEPAFYYGAAGGEVDPGTDCPAGSMPELDWKKVLKTAWRTQAEVDTIMNPEKPQRTALGGIRGPNKENVYAQPWSVPDPGLTLVTGTLAYGFDLDDDAKTGFSSPDGKAAGVDNQYYHVAGCWMAWRSPAKSSHHAKYVNDGMRDGVMAIMVVVSGQGLDPANDPDVTVGFYLSNDKIVKDANGAVARDYSFRVDTDQRFQSLIKARTVNGVVESTERADLKLRDIETAPFFPAQLQLYRGKLRMDLTADGSATALVGGYRPIDDYWSGWAAAGSTHEATTHINLPGYWYALHRYADYSPPDGPARSAISTAYKLYLTPAFMVTPDARRQVTKAELYPASPTAVASAAP